MNTHPDWVTEMRGLLDGLQDGLFDESDSLRLNELLRAGPSQREFYITYMDIHSRLAWDGGQDGGEGPVTRGQGLDFIDAVEEPHAIPSLSSLHSPLSPQFVGGPVFSYMVATVLLCLMLLGAWAYKISHVTDSHIVDNSRRSTISGLSEQEKFVFVGRITAIKDCRWVDPQTNTVFGLGVPIGRRFALASGLLEITYNTGAKVILEGPCAYKVESDAGGYLAVGKLTARVETKGSGFRVQGSKHSPLSTLHSPLFAVRTPTALVTDLGTEFGVEVDEDGDTVSRVFQGSIKVQGLAASVASGTTQTEKILQENESIRVSRVRETHQDSDKTETVRFTQPKTAPKFIRKIAQFTREYVYDFSRCTAGNIDGQDGWQVALDYARQSNTNYINIQPDGPSPMSGNYAVCLGDDHENNLVVRRTNDQGWSYSIPPDAGWEISALIYIDHPDASVFSMFLINKSIDERIDTSRAFGVGSRAARGYNVQWRVGDEFFSARIAEEFYGICRIGMTAKPAGENRYDISLWYETAPGEERTKRIIRTVGGVEADVPAFNIISVAGAYHNEQQPRAPSIDSLTIRVK